jgi:uncharacterized protein YggU (UPF0235/DUF167 family)
VVAGRGAEIEGIADRAGPTGADRDPLLAHLVLLSGALRAVLAFPDNKNGRDPSLIRRLGFPLVAGEPAPPRRVLAPPPHGPHRTARRRLGDVRVAIRVRPGASRTRVGGSYGDSLVVRVAPRAVDGAATEAALAAVADALGLRRRQVQLVAGATSRDKVVEVTGAPDPVLAAALTRLRAAT